MQRYFYVYTSSFFHLLHLFFCNLHRGVLITVNLINKKDVIELLYFESDIIVEHVSGTRLYLTHAPIDVSLSDIKIDEGKYYMNLPDIIQFISEEIFGTPVNALYNSTGAWTHIAV